MFVFVYNCFLWNRTRLFRLKCLDGVVLLISVIGIQAFNTTTISNIHTAILTDYDIDVRPASLTDVHVQFNLLHINELVSVLGNH